VAQAGLAPRFFDTKSQDSHEIEKPRISTDLHGFLQIGHGLQASLIGVYQCSSVVK
jgi:hypothetical protein